MKKERLVRVSGGDYSFYIREYEVPDLSKSIKIEDLKEIEGHLLEADELFKLYKEGILPESLITTIAAKIDQLDVYIFSYYNEDNNLYIPTILKKRNGILTGKKHSNHFYIYKNIGKCLYYVIYSIIAILIVLFIARK